MKIDSPWMAILMSSSVPKPLYSFAVAATSAGPKLGNSCLAYSDAFKGLFALTKSLPSKVFVTA